MRVRGCVCACLSAFLSPPVEKCRAGEAVVYRTVVHERLLKCYFRGEKCCRRMLTLYFSKFLRLIQEFCFI